MRAAGDTTGSYTSMAISGSDTLGFVMAIGDVNSDALTGITWNGVAMTKIHSGIPGADRAVGLWYVVNPASSTTIALTGGTYKQSREFYYTGVSQSAPIDSSAEANSSASAAITVATTVVASNCWTVMVSKDDGSGTITYTVNVGVVREGPDGGGECLSDSNGTVGTGSQSTTQTMASSTANHYGIACSIAPAVAASGKNFFMFF